MYAVEVVIECEKGGTNATPGETYKPGEIIIHPDAWLLCLPGYRNAPALCKPADEETEAKVSAELAARQPVVDQTRAYLQTKIDGYAASGKFTINPVTGFFVRGTDGAYSNKAVIAHTIETAEGYGLKPVVKPAAKPADTAKAAA